MATRIRHAICNEVFQGWAFHDACRRIREIGYDGIEIAPFTLSETPAEIGLEERRQYRDIMRSEGLEFVGLHWLMVAPKGLHVTTPDPVLRAKSWDHIRDLVDLCADLAGNTRLSNGLMIFGSPHQRSTTGGATREEAVKRYRDGLAGVANHALERGVTILAEALPSAQSDVVNTLAEAMAVVEFCNSPSIQTMFDTHNAADETEPHELVVRKYFSNIKHIHVNEMDGKHPGRGGYDFKPLLAELLQLKYGGWVSLEAFDFSFGAETIATESIEYLKKETERIAA